MNKKLIDYLHHYIGCDVYDTFNDVIVQLTPKAYFGYIDGSVDTDLQIKLLLIPVSDVPMSIMHYHNSIVGDAEQIKYLISESVDIFGLIDKKMAFDKLLFKLKEKCKHDWDDTLLCNKCGESAF